MKAWDSLQRFSKPLVFALCLAPCLLLLGDGLRAELGANPIEEITHRTGDWALRLLLITLAITPLKQLLGWPWLIALRRMLGLFAFFYATLHLLTYLLLDQSLLWEAIVEDVRERPYITVGLLAFVLLLPLALTSSNAMMRRMGNRWQRLHRLVYLSGILAVVHFFWLVKADLLEPALYAAVLGLLLGWRLWARLGRARSEMGDHYNLKRRRMI